MCMWISPSIVMQISKGPDMRLNQKHKKPKEDGPIDNRYASMGMQAQSRLPGRL